MHRGRWRTRLAGPRVHKGGNIHPSSRLNENQHRSINKAHLLSYCVHCNFGLNPFDSLCVSVCVCVAVMYSFWHTHCCCRLFFSFELFHKNVTTAAFELIINPLHGELIERHLGLWGASGSHLVPKRSVIRLLFFTQCTNKWLILHTEDQSAWLPSVYSSLHSLDSLLQGQVFKKVTDI